MSEPGQIVAAHRIVVSMVVAKGDVIETDETGFSGAPKRRY
jgi:hypothetical protein